MPGRRQHVDDPPIPDEMAGRVRTPDQPRRHGHVAGSICAAFSPAGRFTGNLMPGIANCARLGWGGYRNGRIPTSGDALQPGQPVHAPGGVAGLRRAVRRRPGRRVRPARQRLPARLRRRSHRRAVVSWRRLGDRHRHPRRRRPSCGPGSPSHAAPSRARRSPGCVPTPARSGSSSRRTRCRRGCAAAAPSATASGGWRGDRCCFLEPWHWEAAGVVLTDPDFATIAARPTVVAA